MNAAVLLWYIGGVALRFLVSLAVEKQINLKANLWLSVAAGVIGLAVAYLFHKMGADGAFANVAGAAIGFVAHWLVGLLYKAQKKIS
jgi:hypothetical protein